MKVYIAKYYLYWGYGNYTEVAAVIVQQSASTALGDALMRYPNTTAGHWTIEEISLCDCSITEITNTE